MFFSHRFRFNCAELSHMLGFSVRNIMDADPRLFPRRLSEEKGPEHGLYHGAIDELARQLNAFNHSYTHGSAEPVYFLHLIRWPQYFPVSAVSDDITLIKRTVVTNASNVIGFGRPMQASDLLNVLRGPFDYSEHGLVLIGVSPKHLEKCRQDEREIVFRPMQHVLRTIDAPGAAESALLEKVFAQHWKRWKRKCPHVDWHHHWKHGSNNPFLPFQIKDHPNDEFGVLYDDAFGFRGLLEGLHRLAKVNAIIKKREHRVPGQPIPTPSGQHRRARSGARVVHISGGPFDEEVQL